MFSFLLQFQIYSSGNNLYGKLGQGVDPAVGAAPVGFQPVSLDADIVKVNIGTNHILAISRDGDLYAWGSNADNQLLSGDGGYWTSPRLISYFKDHKLRVLDADGGHNHTIVLADDGFVYTFGANTRGELGVEMRKVGKTTDEPVRISLENEFCTVTAVYAEFDTSFVVCSNGAAFVFGSCAYGRCGDDVLPSRYYEAPGRISASFKFAQIIAASDTLFAIDTNGSVWAIGSNYNYQLCIPGNFTGQLSQFARVEGLQGAKWIGTGGAHTLALIGSDLYGCGSNSDHQFIANKTGAFQTPVLAATNVQAAACTNKGSLIVKNGNMSAIGNSDSNEWSPFGIIGMYTDWTDVPQAQLVHHVLALKDFAVAFEEYSTSKGVLSAWAIAGIVVAALIVVAVAAAAVWWFCCKKRATSTAQRYDKVGLANNADTW